MGSPDWSTSNFHLISRVFVAKKSVLLVAGVDSGHKVSDESWEVHQFSGFWKALFCPTASENELSSGSNSASDVRQTFADVGLPTTDQLT